MMKEMSVPLPTPTEIAAWDYATIHEFGLPQDVLMENACRGAFAALIEHTGPVAGKRALVLAGSGNNGGDAFALSRYLIDAGARVCVMHTGTLEKYTHSAARNLQILHKMPVEHLIYLHDMADIEACAQLLGEVDILVDGLLGTGFSGLLRENAMQWVTVCNRLCRHAFVLALDIPSGLHGETGTPQPCAIKADLTVSFEANKLGLVVPEALPYVGKVHVCGIGIPSHIKKVMPAGCEQLVEGVFHLLPACAPDTHKGNNGHVLVAGGSRGLSGAAALAGRGALRGGAGLVTIACPQDCMLEIRAGLGDSMTLPLGQGNIWNTTMTAELLEKVRTTDAVVLGPGLGRDESAGEFLLDFLQQYPADTPLVLDADALYFLAELPEMERSIPARTIMTPHPGEAAYLLGTETGIVQSERLKSVRALSDQYGVTVVLKGAGTWIAHPDEPRLLCPMAVPALAVGGSGDVLAGLMGSLLARGLGTRDAAALGVYWHALAGKYLEKHFPVRGNMASDIADALPHAYGTRPQDPC